MSYIIPVQIRWSDLDVNGHIRHSAYYDWGALCRIQFLQEHGLDVKTMQQLQIGPVIFREEAVFKKEIKLEDAIQINLKLLKARKDFSRWTMQHEIIKENNIATLITLDGAWISTALRKLTTPPGIVALAYENMPKSDTFEWLSP